jgi:hypothetical protein
MDKIFLGYASQDHIRRDTLATAGTKVGSLGTYEVVNWESLAVGGRILLRAIQAEIKAARLCIFDVSSLSQNVLFELGFAIGARKRIWLLFDSTDEEAERAWQQLRTLTTVGYVSYQNSDDIRAAFLQDDPANQPKTLYEDAIENALIPVGAPSLFYLPSLHETDAGRLLTRAVEKEVKARGLPLISADPFEAGEALTLPWYAQQVYDAAGVLVHFSREKRRGAAVHNARSALIAGLAVGMDRPLFMVSESDYSAPLDYRDLLYVYKTARACVDHALGWLRTLVETAPRPEGKRLQLVTELRSIRLGQPIAENEEEELGAYFVETANFLEVLEDQVTVFIGRKGTGKTANLYQAADRLRGDRRNLVCLVKPQSYELEGIIRILERYSERDLSSYLAESLWKYLLYSEIARNAADLFRSQPPATIQGTSAQALVEFVNAHEQVISEDFAVRLETVVSQLEAVAKGETIGEAQRTISEVLHTALLRELRVLLKKALSGKERVAVLIDNLDKGWDRTSDLPRLAQLLLGLLVAIGNVRREFARSEGVSSGVSVSLAVFLRTDIYAYVAARAREPDKIPVTAIQWQNRRLLERVIEERFVAGREDAQPAQFWNRFVTKSLNGKDAREYVYDFILPRPRDMVVFWNAAILEAVNSDHSRIMESDIVAASKAYSRFAFRALEVEYGEERPDIEDVMITLVGAPETMAKNEVLERIKEADGTSDDVEAVFRRLRLQSLLGVEVKPNEFSFEEDPSILRVDDALAEKLAKERQGEVQVKIHPAFHPYLGIEHPASE